MKTLALLLLCSMASCTPKRPAESSHEISGTQAERIAAVSQLVSKLAALPSPLLDAHHDEIGTLGTANSYSLAYIASESFPL